MVSFSQYVTNVPDGTSIVLKAGKLSAVIGEFYTILPGAFYQQVSGTWTTEALGDEPMESYFNRVLVNSSAGNNDSVSWKVPLKEGTYQVDIFYYGDTNGAKVDFAFDGVDFLTGLDMYDATANVGGKKSTTTSISITASTLASLTATVNGKNAGSSGYYCRIEAIQIMRTG
jgi:hypothetical protein